jgi:hypothetical protein
MARILAAALTVALALITASTALAQPPADAPYVGGRGLITRELATGMFLNPTSGILNHFEATLQYCATIFHDPGPEKDTIVGHRAIVAVGLFDWVEIGAAGHLEDQPGPIDSPVVGGPTIKARLVKDQGPWPEVAVGGVFLFGDKELQRQTVYVAASKGLTLGDRPFFRSIRGHVGFRQTWFEQGDDGTFGYVGGEIELVRHTFLVAEVSNKSAGADHIPWGVGLQVRHPSGFGFTLAAVQTGRLGNLAIYVGVGLNYQ